MFEEMLQQVGKHTDMMLAYGWKYWYVSIPLFLIFSYAFFRVFCATIRCE